MPTLKKSILLSPNDPILIKKADEIPYDEILSESTKNIIDLMFSVAYEEQSDKKKPILVGLAAPQIGKSKRIIIVDVGADGKGKIADLRVYINPVLVWKSKEESDWYEGCFSTDRVCGIVTRPLKVKIEAYTWEGNKVEEEYSGYVGRIFQHEIEHLDGKVFITHITDPDKLHWVEKDEFPAYRNKEAWRQWPNKCSFSKWEEIKALT